MRIRKRGRCKNCRRRVRLRKNGAVQSHDRFTDHVKQGRCGGSGKAPRPYWEEFIREQAQFGPVTG